MMNYKWFACVALAMTLVVTQPIRTEAQAEGPDLGRLMGQIISQETGAPLSGAQIQVDGTTRGVLSGIEGRYQMDGLPVGPISIRVQYLGYATKVITGVDIIAGETTRMDVSVERQAVEIGAITVTAQQERGSSVSQIGAQRSANSVVSAISAEQISRSPDGDAAAAMRRVSGVTVQDGKHVLVRGMGERYTTSSLNGVRIPSPDPERKIVPLDLFPAGLLQSISTSKTFTPDQPGDFSGGSVDIRTPEFPALRTYSFSIGTGYNPDIVGQTILSGPTAGTEWLARGSGPREITQEALSYTATETRGPEINGIVNSFREAWSVRQSTGRAPVSVSGSMGGSGNLVGRTLGYLGSFTYSNSQEVKLDQLRARYGSGGQSSDEYTGEEGIASVSMGALINLGMLFGTHSQLHLTNTLTRSSDNGARREVGFDEDFSVTLEVERLTYTERWVRSHQLQGEHQIGERQRVDWTLSNSAVRRDVPDYSEFISWVDPEVPIWYKAFEGALRNYASVDEDAYDAQASYAYSFGPDLGDPNRIRVGVAHRRARRDAESTGFRIQPFQWTPTDPRWQLAPEEFFDGRFAQPGDSLFLLAPEQTGGSYSADDELYAGFVMGDLNLTEAIRLLGGVRVESYRVEVNSINGVGQEANTVKEYTDFLPALSGIISLTGSQQLRISATQTLARPEYRELAPIRYREVLGGEQVTGNLDLKRTLVRNLDARWEWYPNPGEVVSFAVFGKLFEDPIEERYIGASGATTRTFANAESAINYGIEVEVNRGLDWIHPALTPFSAFGNLTLMKSRVKVTEGEEIDRPLVGQARYVANSGFAYSDADSRLTATVLYNVVGNRVLNARALGATIVDVLERPRHLVDLSIRLPVLGNAAAKLDIKNLLDSPYRVEQGPVLRQYYRSGRSVSIGLSWSR